MKKGSFKKVLLSVLLSVMVINSFHGIGTYAEERNGEEVTETEDDVLNTEGLSVEGQKEGEFLNTALPANYEVVENEEEPVEEEVNTPEEVEEEEEALEEALLANTAKEVEEEEEELEEAPLVNPDLPDLIDITVKKVWQDGRNPQNRAYPKVRVSQVNGDYEEEKYFDTDDWEVTFSVNKWANESRTVYAEYVVEELPLESAYFPETPDSIILNTSDVIDNTTEVKIVNVRKERVKIQKSWKDSDGEISDGPSGAEVKVTLGEHSVILNEANNWEAVIDYNYMVYDENDVPVTYQLTEDYIKIDGKDVTKDYTLEYNGDNPVKINYLNNSDEDGVRSLRITNNPINSTITVKKIWEDDKTQHEEITVYLKRNGEIVDTQVLRKGNDSAGNPVDFEYTWDKLPGTVEEYTVEEAQVPEGYTESYGEMPVNVTNTTLTITNTSEPVVVTDYGHFNIIKISTGYNGYRIAGAKFTVVNANQEPITLKDGEGPFEYGDAVYVIDMSDASQIKTHDIFPLTLSNGDDAIYHIYETQYPENHSIYRPYSQITPIEGWEEYVLVEYGKPLASTSSTEMYIRNYPLGHIKIVKVDNDDRDKRLEGAEFEIIYDGTSRESSEGYTSYVTKDNQKYYKGDVIVSGLITDENGEAFTGKVLPLYDQRGVNANYILRETKAPLGYQLTSARTGSNTYWTFTNPYPVTVRDKKIGFGGIKITKVGYNYTSTTEYNKETLAGAKFVLINKNTYDVLLENGDVIKPDESYDGGYVSDENGVVEISGVPEGSYLLEEVEAPEGFRVRGIYWENRITVRANQVTEVELSNSRDSIAIMVFKLSLNFEDEALKLVEGSDDLHKFEITLTDEEGNPVNDSYYYKVCTLEEREDVWGISAWRDYESNLEKLEFVDGKYIAEIKSTEIMSIFDIPNSYTYEIQELPSEGYTLIEARPHQFSIRRFLFAYNEKINAKMDIEATKVLEGKDLTADQFEFELKDKDGNVVATAKNTADGKVVFKDVAIDLSQVELKKLNYIDATDEEKELYRTWYGPLEWMPWRYAIYTYNIPDDAVNFRGMKYSETSETERKEYYNWYQQGSVTEGSPMVYYYDLNYVLDEYEDARIAIETAFIHFYDGDLEYTISEVVPEDKGNIEYDAHEETVTVHVETVPNTSEVSAEVKYDDDKATFTNKYVPQEVEFKVSKEDDLLGLEINGAEIEIKDSEGKVVDSWTSDGEPHPVKLKEGTYTFHEEAAPLGFAVVTDIEFKVNADGSIEIISTETTGDTRVEDGVLIVCDARDLKNEKPIVISKVDLNGNPLAGAQVQIFSKNDGNLMYEYTTDGGYETVKLVAGEYIFHEEVAPDGYKAVTDITFELTANGEVKVIDAAGNTVKAEGELLTVTDQPETEPTPTPTPTPTSTPTPKKTTTTKTPTPYTGDNFNVWVWIALLGVGVLLAGGSTYILKRR